MAVSLRNVWFVVALATFFVFVSARAQSDTADGQHSHREVYVIKGGLVAYTPDQSTEAWDHLAKYSIPSVPARAQSFILDDMMACDQGYVPIAAWHEVTGSHPSIDVMYAVDASVTSDGNIAIMLRGREGKRGYAYIDVLVLCRPD